LAKGLRQTARDLIERRIQILTTLSVDHPQHSLGLSEIYAAGYERTQRKLARLRRANAVTFKFFENRGQQRRRADCVKLC
jgi:hypothetical protein